MANDHERLSELFRKAAELSSKARELFLNDLDAETRSRLQALLARDENDSRLPHEAPGAQLANLVQREIEKARHESASECEGSTRKGGSRRLPEEDFESEFPHLRLRECLGAGGMGEVYRADQLRPVRRTVAIKVIQVGMATKNLIARFESERQALAMMDHPNIARVYDAGTTGSGRPYFLMEYVPGIPITEYCDSNRLTTTERLRLFIHVCEAVQHAHQKGVIHRDIKPANVLVKIEDDTPIVKVIDFGIAKAINQSFTEHSLVTHQGQIMGTPEYMSPEQAGTTALDVDTRTDIYSLGVLNYELLVGRVPFSREELMESGFDGMMRLIREVTPPKPSTRIDSLDASITTVVAESRRTAPSTLTKRVRGDLDWITMKALEKDRTRRYGSASEFAADVLAHLHDEPVKAGPPTVSYRLSKFISRHKAVVGGISATFLVLVTGLVVALLLWNRATNAESDALEQANEATMALGLASTEAERSRRATARALSVSAIKRLQELETRAEEECWPRRPETIPAMERWLLDAQGEIDRLVEYRDYFDELEDDNRIDPDLTAENRKWLMSNIGQLISDVNELSGSNPQQTGFEDVERRLAFARSIERRTVDDFESQWKQAIEEIAASPHYGGLEIEPQIGLVPLDTDPDSELWEFWVFESGQRPERGEDDRWIISGETGIVLVLLPGGMFTMGAQGTDPEAPNYDDHMYVDKGPPHAVILDPFFISKYEMTQGQWSKLMGNNPSHYNERYFAVSEYHPVDQVSWNDSTKAMDRLGLELPTESQWEYAARAGTSTPWWTGEDPRDLEEAANLFDRKTQREKPYLIWGAPVSWDDDFFVHAPVGIFECNDFGLHDVHGNVWEWCRDIGASYEHFQPREGDGMRNDPSRVNRVSRGGCYSSAAVYARSAFRAYFNPGYRDPSVGVRASACLIATN